MATSLNDRKIREGIQLLKDAEKCVQTNWLKWKADYDSAADKYTKAGTSFKVGKSYNQAKDAFLKAADAHWKNKSFYHSGKALEQAAAMLKETNKIDEAAELLQRAGALYQENGTPDTAALVLIKGAKMCERTNLNKAIELYQAAGEMKEMDDKLREAAEPYNKASQLLLKQKKFEKATISMINQLDLYGRIGNTAVQYKITLGLVVTHLYEGDYVAADNCFKNGFEISGFGTSDEAEAIEDLLGAYDQSDEEGIKSIVRKPIFRHLDNELSKLARDLKPSEEFNISQHTTELRLVSNDVARLHVDETKPTETRRALQGTSDEKLEHEDDDDNDEEENPLGSYESSGGRTNTQVEGTTDVAGEDSTTNNEPCANKGELDSTADTPSPGNEEESNTKNNEEEEDDEEEEEDEFAGGIC